MDLNLKHRTMLMTTYAAGLRVSELCRVAKVPFHPGENGPHNWRHSGLQWGGNRQDRVRARRYSLADP